jgi:hypothetical protein
VQLAVGRADRALLAVHPVEPVAAALGALAREAVDRLHEAPAVAERDLAFVLEKAHDGVRFAHRLPLGRGDLLLAEVAGDAQLGAAALVLAGTQPAAAERGRDGDQSGKRAQAHQRTVTSTGCERTSPPSSSA